MNPTHLRPEKEILDKKEKLIITGGSSSFGPSVLALLGSLTLNWPEHPPVLVYDLGFDDETLRILSDNHVMVKKVPAFVPHWRKHFTWKVWCWNDAPARDVFWLDAGVVVLNPLNDVFEAIDRLGYFINPAYFLLSDTATEAACLGCGVDTNFRSGKMTFNGGVVGFRKEGQMGTIISRSLEIASVEEYIKSTIPLGRHDQTIFSLLIHKHIQNPIMLDTMVYAGWLSPHQVHGQKVWQHRRTLSQTDLDYFKEHISVSGDPYIPINSPQTVQRGSFLVRLQHLLKKSPKEILSIILAKMLMRKKIPERQIYDGVRD